MFRSEKLRRHVADMPCVNCGRADVQAAHANLGEFGKGMGMKASDAALMSLCCACHTDLDQGSTMDKQGKRDFQYQMIARTLVRAIEQGRLVVK